MISPDNFTIPVFAVHPRPGPLKKIQALFIVFKHDPHIIQDIVGIFDMTVSWASSNSCNFGRMIMSFPLAIAQQGIDFILPVDGIGPVGVGADLIGPGLGNGRAPDDDLNFIP